MATSDSNSSAHVVVVLRGAIDVATVHDAFERVLRAGPSPGGVVTLDLSEVDFIDSIGVSMFLEVQRYLDAMGCRLALANPSAPVMRLLTLLGLTDMFSTDDGSASAT